MDKSTYQIPQVDGGRLVSMISINQLQQKSCLSFNQQRISSEKVKRQTREQLIAFFDRHVASGSPTRRQLSTHVYAQSMAPPQLRVQLPGDDFYPAPRDLLLV